MPMDPKTARVVLKIASAGIAMLAYGAIHRTDKLLSEKIDERYPDPKSEETPQED